MTSSRRRSGFVLVTSVAATVAASTIISLLSATTDPGGSSAAAGEPAASASAEGAGWPGHGSRPVTVSTDPQQLSVVGLPCFPGNLALTMTNTGKEPRYADLTLDPSGPLTLSRELFSSYLPALDPDQPVTAPVEVRVPRDSKPGSYKIDLEVDKTKLTVPVQVNPLPPKGPGSNVALGEQAAASSTHGNFALCGAVDGDKDSEHWDTLTGWNDGTRAIFPDTYDVALAAPTTIDRVELYTLDSVKYPAATNGMRDWDVQVRSGSGAWQTVAQVRANVAGHVTSTFSPTQADAIRILALAGNGNTYSRIVELEAYGS
ncbi:MAG TPA: discoidin domain-containing protein [Kribbella sp.]|uniref:discoidin domain-containing protein n=1 Tax=Kribbella sp. TaxID=1871183 RepID=UPI002D794521|nr:discoidin domain-containing protein [Kribbella sp.]HET6291748.1 discoidin domain-containing protein [Kribbella sp.]